jgi:hypothetical protein
VSALAACLSGGCYLSHLGPVEASVDGGPGEDADCGVEICNGRTDDCDARIDEGAMCPCPVQHFGTHAYLYCPTDESWDEALRVCRGVGYELATIERADENAWIFGVARSVRGESSWWFGLNDRDEEGAWHWSDGSVEPAPRWAEGEPNEFFADEDCGDLLPDDGGAWNDESCTFRLPFVCEAGP